MNRRALPQWRGLGFWNEELLSSRHRQPGTRISWRKCKDERHEVRREGAGQGADRGTEKALEELLEELIEIWESVYMKMRRKKSTRILGEETQNLQELGEAAPHLSVFWPRKSARFIKTKRSLSPVIRTGLIVQNILMNADWRSGEQRAKELLPTTLGPLE